MRDAYRTLAPFRNICAHGDRLFCARVSSRNEKKYVDLITTLRTVLIKEDISKYLQGLSNLLKRAFDLGAAVETVYKMMGFSFKGPLSFISTNDTLTANIIDADGKILTPWFDIR